MPRWSSQVSELWKGEYKDQEVVLKVFRGTTDAQKSVSVFRAIQKGEGALSLILKIS